MHAGRDESPHRARASIDPTQRLEVCEPQLKRDGLARIKLQRIVRRYFRSHLIRIDSGLVAINQIFVECVFYIGGAIFPAEEPRGVGLVLCEHQLGLTRA